MPKWPVLIAGLLFLGCMGPKVVPTFQDPQFKLGALMGQRVAVWPLAKAVLDADTTQTMGKEYGSLDRFMDGFSGQLSGRLVPMLNPDSISSDQVLKALAADPADRELLDPGRLLGKQDPTNRFATPTVPSRLASLARLPLLKGVRYVIVPRDLTMGRNVTSTPGTSGFVTNDKGEPTFVVTPGSSSAATGARLRITIVDLTTSAIVWDGSVFAKESSNVMVATAFHQAEDELIANFENQVLGL